MPRPAVHEADAVLDAARELILRSGPRGAGIRDIALRSGAPSGSLYHRFRSRDKVVAMAWLRAAARFQAGYVRALATEDPHRAIADAIAWGVRFAISEPQDTMLLLCFGQRDLLDADPDADVAAQLIDVNRDVERAVGRLSERLFGSVGAAALERATFAAIDLPYAVLRRHLLAGTLSLNAVAPLQAAAIAIVTDTEEA